MTDRSGAADGDGAAPARPGREVKGWETRAVSARDAVRGIGSGMRVFVHGASATPTPLIDALAERTDLEGVLLYHLHLSGRVAFAAPELAERFRPVAMFTGANMREAVNEGRADFMPVFLSDIPALFTSRRIRLDAAILQLSPPDRHGLCTLGTSVDAAKAATDSAPVIIAEINERMPRTHGNVVVPFHRISAFVHSDRPLIEHPMATQSPEHGRIAELVAELIENGSTLQMGIGGIPEAVLARLGEKRDLGVHTEMFSDGLLDLVESGAVTNRRKRVSPGRIITALVTGTQRLFDFVHDNPLVEFHPCDRTNDTRVILQNPKVVAINSAIEVDLSGQVCADSIGHRIHSGIGGQMDFIRGAALSNGGKPIIALPSTARGGTVSRIVAELRPGSGVVTTRGHVHWVVTEHGAVNLHGLTLRERGEALVSIAHPDFRSDLSRELRAIRHFVMG